MEEEEEVFMSRSPWKRAIAAVLVVLAITLAMPAKANAAASNMDSFFYPANRILSKAMDWIRHLWPVGGPNAGKFGAGQSSDGRTSSKAYF